MDRANGRRCAAAAALTLALGSFASAQEFVQNGIVDGDAPAFRSSFDHERRGHRDHDRPILDFLVGDPSEGSWIAGAETTFLYVDAKTGGITTMSFDDSGTAGTDFAAIGQNGVEDFGVAPRVWIGRRITDKWAIVGRYWRLNEESEQYPQQQPFSAQLPHFATISDSAETELYTADLEVIRSFEIDKWKLDGSVGARYGSFDTSSRMYAFGVFTTGNFVNLNHQTHSSFDGAGVTAALAGRRQVADSPLFVLASARGSRMDGHSDSMARSSGTVASSPSAPLVGAATVTRNDAEAAMNIFEMQFGLEYQFQLAYVPGVAFVRTSFEYQHWNIDGPPTGGAGFGGTIGTLTTNSFSSADLGDAKLAGVGLSAGLTW